MKKLNWNSPIKVKLTELGKEIYRSQYDDLNKMRAAKGYSLFDRPEPEEDENGFVHILLWKFMQLYGDNIGMGYPNVVQNLSFYIDEGELEEAKPC